MSKLCKIMIVDDELIMRQGIKHMLDWESEGFTVVGDAANGREAVELIRVSTPNIVITDIIMPVMDGIELAQFIQEEYPQIRIVVLSGYSDFEYVKSSFKYGVCDYILKPTLNPAELLKTLKKIAGEQSLLDGSAQSKPEPSHTDNVLNRLILGFDGTVDFAELEAKFPHQYFCLYGINTTKAYSDYETRHKLIEHTILAINADNFKDCVLQLTDVNKEILVLAINFDSQNSVMLNQKLAEISSSIIADFSDAFFVLSEQFSSVHDIKNNYENSFLKRTEQQFYHKGEVLFSGHIRLTGTDIAKFDFKHFSELVSMLQLTEAFAFLKQYVTQAVSSRALTEFDLKSLIQNALYNVITTLEALSFDATSLNALKHDYFSKIDSAKYSSTLLLIFNEILEDFESITQTYQNKINSHIINKIIAYIHEHFDEPLALADVAKKFNFNYYYLSSYFSSHNSEGFNEFLNKIRIDKAIELLKSDIPISDISSMVGYSEHSYFCRVFKKFTGTTPSHYRKIAANKSKL